MVIMITTVDPIITVPLKYSATPVLPYTFVALNSFFFRINYTKFQYKFRRACNSVNFVSNLINIRQEVVDLKL